MVGLAGGSADLRGSRRSSQGSSCTTGAEPDARAGTAGPRTSRRGSPTHSPSWTPPALERPVVGGLMEGGASMALLAAMHPDRIRSLVWVRPVPRALAAPDYPWGVQPSYVERESMLIGRVGHRGLRARLHRAERRRDGGPVVGGELRPPACSTHASYVHARRGRAADPDVVRVGRPRRLAVDPRADALARRSSGGRAQLRGDRSTRRLADPRCRDRSLRHDG